MRGRHGEIGSAIAEFALVAGLVAVLFMGVLQLGLALHIRNTLLQSAVEGARYGARADVPPGGATARTRDLITGFASADYAAGITESLVEVGGARVVQVTVRAPLPVLATLGPARTLTVVGRAYKEGQ